MIDFVATQKEPIFFSFSFFHSLPPSNWRKAKENSENEDKMKRKEFYNQLNV